MRVMSATDPQSDNLKRLLDELPNPVLEVDRPRVMREGRGC